MTGHTQATPIITIPQSPYRGALHGQDGHVMARPHPPHTHKADTAERGTLPQQEGAQFHALIQQIQKDHEIVASICGVSTINVEEMCGCCEVGNVELPGSQVLWSCITTACAHDHHCHVLPHTPLT